jgi:hypothetical protein
MPPPSTAAATSTPLQQGQQPPPPTAGWPLLPHGSPLGRMPSCCLSIPACHAVLLQTSLPSHPPPPVNLIILCAFCWKASCPPFTIHHPMHTPCTPFRTSASPSTRLEVNMALPPRCRATEHFSLSHALSRPRYSTAPPPRKTPRLLFNKAPRLHCRRTATHLTLAPKSQLDLRLILAIFLGETKRQNAHPAPPPSSWPTTHHPRASAAPTHAPSSCPWAAP